MIKLNNVNVVFNEFEAVKNVNLEINKGDIYGIVGFSGAGKSTLVRTINLLQNVSSGEVLIMGEDITKLNEKELRKQREKIGMIFQHFNLLKSLNVLENVVFSLRNTKLTKNEKIEKARKLLKLVDLEEKEKQYPSELSGGQKQRVAIARALANDPEILLCDEATSALDPQTTKQILKLLKKVNDEIGITIVLITHEMSVIKDVCNKVAIMDRGSIIENGTVFDIFSNPKNEITQKFINSVHNNEGLIESLSKLDIKLNDTKRLFKLTYVGEISTEPIINNIYTRYKVVSNILWGNIEFISNKPLGNLIIVFEGEHIYEAVNYLESVGALISEIKLESEVINYV
ncbi:methionine ABC transporter ATP-binding protein [Streptobacillus felis]|uniref:Methionine ABC transporter ATP-binding protein n=1 Tax=Streptobacillus felis TaxID=1384509 RepID=A0A7Z0PFL1_9FUSO|nr:methionine ABC transporter ATP-binding protein [Streptobacillus felis]NYV28363.1 methionine ABC transporter ATP-binding protein [Streptobacillus felis]